MLTLPINPKIRGMRPPQGRSAGFSLFELIAFIILAAIVYSASVDRFGSFPAEAERANFLAVSTQIQTGVSMESYMLMARGSGSAAFAEYEGANPMNFLLETPVNYIGEFGAIDRSTTPGRIWYFDTSSGELVYLIDNTQGVFLTGSGGLRPTDEIRFRVQVEYRGSGGGTQNGEGAGAGSAGSGRVSGMLMRPVIPYQWGTSGAILLEEATAPPPETPL